VRGRSSIGRAAVSKTVKGGNLQKCNKCGEQLPVEEFCFRDKASGERHKICKRCQRAYKRAHYCRNREYYCAHAKANTARYRERNRAFLHEYLEAHPCVDCGESDIRVLEFDHVKGEKVETVSRLATWGISVVRLKGRYRSAKYVVQIVIVGGTGRRVVNCEFESRRAPFGYPAGYQSPVRVWGAVSGRRL